MPPQQTQNDITADYVIVIIVNICLYNKSICDTLILQVQVLSHMHCMQCH